MKRLLLLSLAVSRLCFAEPETIEYARRQIPLHLDIHHPIKKAEHPSPVILWMHGGGWRNGSRKNSKRVEWLTAHGWAIVSIDYRLTDAAPFPAQLEDCRAALQWLRDEGEDHHLDPARIVVSGLSAGAHLASLLAVSLPEESDAVSGVLHFYGPSDFVQMSRYAKDSDAPLNQPDSNVYQLLGGPLRDNLELAGRASPVTHLDRNDPPLLILVGDQDSLMTQRQCRRLHEAAKTVGIDSKLHVIPGAGHGGPEFSDSTRRELILDFLTSLSS
jgi:acetyl esterase/lipase